VTLAPEPVRRVEKTCHQHRNCLRKHSQEETETSTQVPVPPPTLLPPAELPRTQIIERTRHRYEDIHRLLEKGWTISAIARKLVLDRKTVRRFRDTDLDQLLGSARDRRSNGVLEPFKTPQALNSSSNRGFGGEGCVFVEQPALLETAIELAQHAVEKVALGCGVPVSVVVAPPAVVGLGTR
jgi:hypothetical protein